MVHQSNLDTAITSLKMSLTKSRACVILNARIVVATMATVANSKLN